MIDYHEVDVMQCKLEIMRVIYNWGYQGHPTPIDDSLRNQIHETNGDACKQMHLTGVFEYTDRQIISDLNFKNTS